VTGEIARRLHSSWETSSSAVPASLHRWPAQPRGFALVALIGATALAAISPASAQTAGLVAAYAFDEGSGTTAVDSSGNNNTGTIDGARWTTAGLFGNALVFNGSARVTVANAASLQPTTGMTLEAWVNPSAVTNVWRDVIYKGNDNYFLEATSTNGSVPGAGGTFGEVYGAAPLQANTWTHLAVTYDKVTLRLYVNGVEVSSVARTESLATSTYPLEIGGDSIYGQYFEGMIDEVRVYSVALSQAQIQADMNTPVGSAPADTQAPTAPASLTATPVGSGQMNLNWSASTDDVAVTGYLVERCQGAGCTVFSQIASSAGTSYSNTDLTGETSYSYRVRATDAVGNLSVFSPVASATTGAAPDTTAPSAPTNLTATVVSGSSINLSWTASTDNVGVTGYRVERCQDAGCTSFVQIAAPSGTPHSDTGLLAGTTYRYQVRATDAAGNLSPYSVVADATILAPDTEPPTAPATVTATVVSGTQIDLTWSAAQDNVAVTGYRVERCQGAACTDFVKIATPTGTLFSDTVLTPNTNYSYVVRATDAAWNLGPYSNAASATTLATVPELMAAYSFEEGTGSTVGDSSGRGNTGSIQNATWTTAGRYGKALVFDGSSRVDIPDSASLRLTTAMTLEAWVNPTIVTRAWRDVIYKGNDNYFLEATSMSDNSAPAAGGTFGEVYGTTPLAADTWTHLAVTYDTVTLRLYVNGVQVSSAARSESLATSANPVQIGGDSIYGQYFEGTIDEVRIYNVARTPTQIQADMNTPIGSARLPGVNLSRASIDFGPQDVGTTSDPQVLTLTNGGDAQLSISEITIVGPQGSDFTIQSNTCGSSLAPLGSCAVSLAFGPSAGGARSATLTISDNAPGSPHTVALAGTATGALTVSPSVSVVTPMRTQQFVAIDSSVVWSVDGVVGGTATAGTITSMGLYAPPDGIGTHTVTATTQDHSRSATATVYVSGYPGKFTHHSDNARTGQNLNETVLTSTNVTAATFGKLFSYPLDGAAYASPLYVADVDIPGRGYHNVVYVATQHNSVYAFDADGASGAPLWQASFINPGAGVTAVPASETGECCDITPEIGISGTPVIDPSTGTLYVVAKTKEVVGPTTRYVQRLHALDITTGAEKFGGPVEIQASAPGSGTGSQGGQISFNPLRENQRPALLLSNGVVYIAFGSHGDNQPYHGWVLGYSATTLQPVMAFLTTPNGTGGGIWLSNAGPATDSAGNIYFATANGTFNASTGDYADSIVKISPDGTVLDYFTPYNEATFDAGNLDLGAGGVLLLPDQNCAHPHLLVMAGKPGTIYLVDRDNMGQHNPNNDSQIVQSLVNIFPYGTPEPGNYSAPVYFNGTVYFSPVADAIKAFRLSNGLLSTSPTSQSPQIYAYPGGTLTVSANGSTDGILWAVRRNGATAPGTLHAYDPANLGIERYNSDQAGSRDTLDVAVKFSVPLVANGKVFVSSMSRLTVYGLLP
jgi:fibronectin type 3 domain-containing protein